VKRRQATTLMIAVLACLAMLALWSSGIFEPRAPKDAAAVAASATPASAIAAQPAAESTAPASAVASQPYAASDQDLASRAAGRSEIRDTLEVTGRLAQLGSVTLYLEGPTGAVLKIGRSDGEGRFHFTMPVPLDDVGVHTLEADGKERRHHFTRDPEAGRTDWDLGQIAFPGDWITVRFQIDYEPAVIAAMVAHGQRTVTASVHESRSNGPLVAERSFDLEQLPPGERMAFQEVRVESHASNGTLAVEWIGHDKHWPKDLAAFGRHVLLPAELGLYRTARLALRPESVVRGRLLWADGTPSTDILATYQPADQVPYLQQFVGPDGTFVFVVGENGRGTVTMDGWFAQMINGQQERVAAAAGDEVELRTSLVPVRFRLLDDGGQPIERFAVMGLWGPRGLPTERHPGGLAFTLRQCLERGPWLEFALNGRHRVFPVPTLWFDGATTVRDVHTSDFLPVGALRIDADQAGRNAASKPRFVLDLHGTGLLADYRRSSIEPRDLPWRIDDLPAGAYDFEVVRGPKLNATKGTVAIAPGQEAELRLR
jgi:hypothetical protein